MEQTSNNNAIRAGGSVVFWVASASSRAILMDELAKLGMVKACPEPKSRYSALRDAAKRVYPSAEGYDVFGLAKNGGVEVIQIVTGSDRNEYRHEDTLAVDQDGMLLDCRREDEVRAAYQDECGKLDAAAITTLMVGTISEAKGVTLRPTGGFYWVKDSEAAKVRAVAEAAKKASLSGTTKAYFLNVAHDGDMVMAVTDALTTEIMGEVEAVTAEIATGEMGKRALETRRSHAVALARKVQELATSLGADLSRLTAALETVHASATKAILLDAAQADVNDAAANPVAALFGTPSDL